MPITRAIARIQLLIDLSAAVRLLSASIQIKKGTRLIHSSTGNPATVTISQETSMVIAVPSGATANITGTYALATLTAYSNLRQSISTTVTSSPTQPGQPVVTAAVVIFAGGVAWYLAGVAGAVGDEAAILTPPDEAGGHPDDSQCPNAKPTCSDCGGINSICILPSAGCTCEDSKPETCPQQKPNCDAETCKGDENNKCTVENKGCGCVQAGPTCPDATEAMFCSQCGGEGSDVSKCSDGAPCCVGVGDVPQYIN
jgi:hypothetical protein